jgi:serine/threonine protein phosphatase 1
MDPVSVPLVQHFPVNTQGRDFVVGDLHGCVDALRYLLRTVSFDGTRDRLFSVGDLVDRGTQSVEAIGLLDKPWFHAVLGNHEDSLCAVVEGRLKRHWWYSIGGAWSSAVPERQLHLYAQRLQRMPLVIVVGSGGSRFNVLHAEFFGDDHELDSGKFSEEVLHRLLWGRDLATGAVLPARQSGLSTTYCGHTPMREIRHIGAQVFIDTGAFAPGGKLTLIEALTARHWQVSVEMAREQGAASIALP